MDLEKHTKKMYDKYGEEYQNSRDKNDIQRVYNECLEMPCMFKTVKNIKNKSLLDIGCGAGVHIKEYTKKGAKCFGIDISKTMISLAKKNNPSVDFKVGSVTKLPYKDNSFDVITSSLCFDYIENLIIAFKEVSRVLKKGGIFYYSYDSPVSCLRENFENEDYKISAIGKFKDKKNNKTYYFGVKQRYKEWDMVSGMHMKTYNYSINKHLKAIVKNNLELIDLVDCYPNKEFKKRAPEKYKKCMKFPIYTIYICKKK